MGTIYPATCGTLSRVDAPDCETNYKGKHVCRSDRDHGGTYHRCFCGVIWKRSDDNETDGSQT